LLQSFTNPLQETRIKKKKKRGPAPGAIVGFQEKIAKYLAGGEEALVVINPWSINKTKITELQGSFKKAVVIPVKDGTRLKGSKWFYPSGLKKVDVSDSEDDNAPPGAAPPTPPVLPAEDDPAPPAPPAPKTTKRKSSKRARQGQKEE
jgi:hypothetical protein